MEKEQQLPIFEQVKCDLLIDGLFKVEGNGLHFTTRYTKKDDGDNAMVEERSFKGAELFTVLNDLVMSSAKHAQLSIPPQIASGLKFGTDDAEAFIKFLAGQMR